MSHDPRKKVPRPNTKIDRVKLIDELGKLDRDLAGLAELKARRDVIADLLRLEARAFPASAGLQWDGIKHAVQLGPNGNERTITDKSKLIAVIGQELFNAVASIPLGKLDEICPNAEALGLLKKEATGKRTVKTFMRAAGAK